MDHGGKVAPGPLYAHVRGRELAGCVQDDERVSDRQGPEVLLARGEPLLSQLNWTTGTKCNLTDVCDCSAVTLLNTRAGETRQNCERQYTSVLLQLDESPQNFSLGLPPNNFGKWQTTRCVEIDPRLDLLRRRARPSRSPPVVRITRNLRLNRIAELRSAIEEDERTLRNLASDLSDIKQGRWDDRLPQPSSAEPSQPATLQANKARAEDAAMERNEPPIDVGKALTEDNGGGAKEDITEEAVAVTDSDAVKKRSAQDADVEIAAAERDRWKAELPKQVDEETRGTRHAEKERLLDAHVGAGGASGEQLTPAVANTPDEHAATASAAAANGDDERASASKPAAARIVHLDLAAAAAGKGAETAGGEERARNERAEGQREGAPAVLGEYLTRSRKRSLSLSVDALPKTPADVVDGSTDELPHPEPRGVAPGKLSTALSPASPRKKSRSKAPSTKAQLPELLPARRSSPSPPADAIRDFPVSPARSSPARRASSPRRPNAKSPKAASSTSKAWRSPSASDARLSEGSPDAEWSAEWPASRHAPADATSEAAASVSTGDETPPPVLSPQTTTPTDKTTAAANGAENPKSPGAGEPRRAEDAGDRSSPKKRTQSAQAGGAARSSNFDRDRVKKWKKLILPIWSRVADHRHGPMFMHPVKEKEVPGYYEAVRRPMTLTDVKKRVTSGVGGFVFSETCFRQPPPSPHTIPPSRPKKRKNSRKRKILKSLFTAILFFGPSRYAQKKKKKAITSTAEFHRDVLQVFANALMFNKDNSEVYRMAAELHHDARRTILQHVQTERAVHRRDAGGGCSRRTSVSVCSEGKQEWLRRCFLFFFFLVLPRPPPPFPFFA
ncbi:MAG: hypothetical protein BJ554DRAFT_1790 [Olpidium bornovanus]|uniref:Bromo domain-containing protein n=1 Tax=Olpidium bornovanus TaxID=278681 RepID=A0A8H8DGT8_9FUNG|nr:MAG: hypothetical protein BJ554DRAFT_1790 [Olpidium bornovanus]